jgi:phosphoribosylaminoimidazolecarboxamide formyltransferase/IMP cyclohydrolase
MNKRKALISLSDKTGAPEFARALLGFGFELLSTGGTARLLREAQLPVVEIGDYTGFPEMLDGRVKTLHPKVHAGILARRDLPEHVQALTRAGIPAIDLVAVNLYPFEQTIAGDDCTLEQAIENIDIGGPTMVRAAAKNWRHVAVVTDPADYPVLIAEMKSANGAISIDTRYRLARKAISHTEANDC